MQAVQNLIRRHATFHIKKAGLIWVNRTGSEAGGGVGFSKDIRSLLLPPVKLVFSSSLHTANYNNSRNQVVCVCGGGWGTLILRIYVGTDHFWGSKFVISIYRYFLRGDMNIFGG